MTAFRFPLDRVLDWRRLQLRAEEEKLAALQRRLDAINHHISALGSAELKHEWSLRKLPAVGGEELHALSAFQARSKKQRAALTLERQKFEAQVEAQRARLLKARRDCRALEKLKERRQEAWCYLRDREIENNAADAHLAKLIRARGEE